MLILEFCLPTFLGASVIYWISFCFWPDLYSSLDVSLSLVSDRKYISVCFLNLLIYKRVVIVICKIYCLLISCDALPSWLVSVSAASSNCSCLVPSSFISDLRDLDPQLFSITFCDSIFKIILSWDCYYQNEYLFVMECLFTFAHLSLKPNELFSL